LLAQHIQTRAQCVATPQIAWLPWQVIAKDNGTFFVARESGGGSHRQFIKNAVGKATIFRRQATAEAACAKANRGAA
jgi:hypothetical protein